MCQERLWGTVSRNSVPLSKWIKTPRCPHCSILQLLEGLVTNTFFSLSPRSVWWIGKHKLGNKIFIMQSHSDSYIYRLFSAGAYHNSKTKTELGFSIYDSSTMEGLNNQSTKWNCPELNCEVSVSVSLAKKINSCYATFALTKKAILNTGGLLTVPWIPTAKLGITDIRRAATGVGIFLRRQWGSALIST